MDGVLYQGALEAASFPALNPLVSKWEGEVVSLECQYEDVASPKWTVLLIFNLGSVHIPVLAHLPSFLLFPETCLKWPMTIITFSQLLLTFLNCVQWRGWGGYPYIWTFFWPSQDVNFHVVLIFGFISDQVKTSTFRWVPTSEKPVFLSFAYVGGTFGTIITYPVQISLWNQKMNCWKRHYQNYCSDVWLDHRKTWVGSSFLHHRWHHSSMGDHMAGGLKERSI